MTFVCGIVDKRLAVRTGSALQFGCGLVRRERIFSEVLSGTRARG
jgi:hypothetical protein